MTLREIATYWAKLSSTFGQKNPQKAAIEAEAPVREQIEAAVKEAAVNEAAIREHIKGIQYAIATVKTRIGKADIKAIEAQREAGRLRVNVEQLERQMEEKHRDLRFNNADLMAVKQLADHKGVVIE